MNSLDDNTTSMAFGTIKGIELLIDKFYTNFLLRDMVYITSGAFVVFIFLVSTGLVPVFIKSPEFFKVLTIVGCYYIGLTNQELMVACKFFRMFPRDLTKNFVIQETETILNIMMLIDSTTDKKVGDSFKRVERIFTIKNIMTSFGSALLMSLIILLFRGMQDLISYNKNNAFSPLFDIEKYILTIFVLVALIIGAISSNRRKADVQEKLLVRLTDEIKEAKRQAAQITAPQASAVSIQTNP